MANQFRDYCLTINNEERTDIELSEYIKTLTHLKYFVFQREKGSQEGTEHIQLYIEFTQGKRFEFMKNAFPRAHIETRKGSKTQARNYCMKTESRIADPIEYGDFVEVGERSDLADIMQLVKDGATDIEIMELYPSQYIRYSNAISTCRQKFLIEKYKTTFRKLEVIYIYGSAGIGKTRHVMEEYGYQNVFRVTNYDKDSFYTYEGQNVIVFEEFRSSFPIEKMLNYLDGYPLMLPSRYNDKVACYNIVYLISNIPLSEQYKTIQTEHKETWNAFLRRITKCYNFDLSKVNSFPPTAEPLTNVKIDDIF